MLKVRVLASLVAVFGAYSLAVAQFTGPAPVTWRWQQPSTVVPNGQPLAVGNTIYVTSGQRLYALDRTNGNQIWRFPVGTPLASLFRGSPVYSNGTVYACADNKILYAIDAQTGQQKWMYRSDEHFIGSPVMAGKIILVENADGNIIGVNSETGKSFYDAPLPVDNGILGQISAWGNDVICFNGNNSLVAINVSTRALDWKDDFTQADPDTHPEVVGNNIYCNTGGYLVSLQAATGRLNFSKNIGADLAYWPGVSSNGVAAVSKDGNVYCFDLSGNPINKDPISLSTFPITAPTGLQGGDFVFPTADGAINLVDPSKGVIWSYIVRPIGGETTAAPSDSSSGGNGMSGPGAGLGGPSSGKGNGLNQNNNSKPIEISSIQASAPAVLAGTTLIQMNRDGSIIAFDPTTGVDLTPPSVDMTFPNPGSMVSGQPPFAIAFKIKDNASGINRGTLKISINGKTEKVKFKTDGVAIIYFSQLDGNPLLDDGLQTVDVHVADWMGNVTDKSFVIHIDNSLPPVSDVNKTTDQTGKGNGPNGGAGAAG